MDLQPRDLNLVRMQEYHSTFQKSRRQTTIPDSFFVANEQRPHRPINNSPARSVCVAEAGPNTWLGATAACPSSGCIVDSETRSADLEMTLVCRTPRSFWLDHGQTAQLTSCVDEGATSPTPRSPLKPSVPVFVSPSPHISAGGMASGPTTIKTPLISGTARISKTAVVPQSLRQLSMPRLADCILDLKLCSSPAPCITIQTQAEDCGGEVLQLPHHASVKDAIKRITPQTMTDLLDGRYAQRYDRLIVVDCRYPYEFAGGHIPGAVNVNTPDAIDRLLLNNPPSNSHTCLVFHCEFSSQRAPRMALHVRNFDRLLNSDRYPVLYYPEVYVLDGGYKAFYDQFSERCEPPGQYVPMKNPVNKEELKNQQRLRQSFRGHWAHSHVSKRPAKFFRKSQSLTMDPARSFFKQLSESSLARAEATRQEDDPMQLDQDIQVHLVSVNEFELSGSALGLHDLPSSVC